MQKINAAPIDKIISALSYITGGLVGFIWLIGCTLLKKRISKFLLFNIYQAICLSLFIGFFNILFVLIHDLLIMIPIVNVLINSLWLALNSPVLYGRSILGIIIFIIYVYLALMTLIGKVAYLPWISKIIMYQIDRFNGGEE